jgi:hypothetical protein
MHPDRKIGFALGILLIGIVGALFFRNEPLLVDDVPSVRREKLLNEQLRERDIAVYLDDSADSAIADRDSKTVPGDPEPTWTMPDLLRDLDSRNDDVPLPVGSTAGIRSRKTASASENDDLTDGFRKALPDGPDESESDDSSNILSSDDRSELPLLPGMTRSLRRNHRSRGTSKDSVAKSATGSSESVAETEKEVSSSIDLAENDQSENGPENSVPADVEFDEYTVQYGDTLSGISERKLGTQGRFEEIYDLNRDRISTPDRLKVGESLRIPRQ